MPPLAYTSCWVAVKNTFGPLTPRKSIESSCPPDRPTEIRAGSSDTRLQNMALIGCKLFAHNSMLSQNKVRLPLPLFVSCCMMHLPVREVKSAQLTASDGSYLAASMDTALM